MRERADGPSLYGMQTWLALPDGQEEIDPAFEHVDGAALPLVEERGRVGAGADGDAMGQDRRGHRA